MGFRKGTEFKFRLLQLLFQFPDQNSPCGKMGKGKGLYFRDSTITHNKGLICMKGLNEKIAYLNSSVPDGALNQVRTD